METKSEPLISSESTTKSSSEETKNSTTETMVSMDEPLGELDGALNRLAINTSNKLGLNLKTLSLKQLYLNQWQHLKSWGSFIDTNRMKTPNSTLQWSRRIVRNVDHFQSNYLCVFLILVIYCVLTSPLLLLAMAANLGACYIVMLKNSESPLKLFGRQLSLAKQYLFVMIASIPLFYLAGAGSAVFWVQKPFIFN